MRSEGDWSQGGRCRTKDAGFIYSLVLPPVDERFVTKKPVSLGRWTVEQHFGQDRSSQAGLGNGGTGLLPTPGGEGSARWFVALTHLCKCENFHRVKASLLEPQSWLGAAASLASSGFANRLCRWRACFSSGHWEVPPCSVPSRPALFQQVSSLNETQQCFS